MNRINKFNKYLYTFIFSMLSVLVFLIEYKAYEPSYLTSDNSFLNFFTEIYFSISKFDIIHVALWIFILYFYYNVYFDGKKYGKKNMVYTVMAIFFTILTIVAKSYGIDNTLNTLYSSGAQILKTIIYIFGFYLIYYAILKKLFGIRPDWKNVKKKL